MLRAGADPFGKKVVEPREYPATYRSADKSPSKANETANGSDVVTDVNSLHQCGPVRYTTDADEPPGRQKHDHAPPYAEGKGKGAYIQFHQISPK